MQLSKKEIDKYDEVLHDPPSCLISFCGSSDDALSVQCSLSLKDVTDPVLIFKVPQILGK